MVNIFLWWDIIIFFASRRPDYRLPARRYLSKLFTNAHVKIAFWTVWSFLRNAEGRKRWENQVKNALLIIRVLTFSHHYQGRIDFITTNTNWDVFPDTSLGMDYIWENGCTQKRWEGCIGLYLLSDLKISLGPEGEARGTSLRPRLVVADEQPNTSLLSAVFLLLSASFKISITKYKAENAWNQGWFFTNLSSRLAGERNWGDNFCFLQKSRESWFF